VKKLKYVKILFCLALLIILPVGAFAVQTNTSGFEWQIEPQFAFARSFSEGLAAVSVDGELWGFIDRHGNMVIEPQFANAHSFAEGLAAVDTRLPDTWIPKWGFIDINGNMVIEPQYERVSAFSEGLAAVQIGRVNWGFIDRNGNIVIEPYYTSPTNFSGELAAVQYAHQHWYLIDRNGIRSNVIRVLGISSISEGMVRFQGFAGTGQGFLDTNGNVVIEPQFAYATDFSGGHALVRLDDGTRPDGSWYARWAYIDTNGNIAHHLPNFHVSDGLGLISAEIDVHDSDKTHFVYGYKDVHGNTIIEPQFENANDFSEGLAAVWVQGYGWGFISSPHATPQQVTPAPYLTTQSEPPQIMEAPTEPEAIVPESAATETRILRFIIGNAAYTDNGMSRALETAPFIADNRTMVPLSVIGEVLGATNLDLTDSVVSFTLNGITITMTVGEPLPNNMGTPVIVAGRTFVPLAFIINEMGATARWDSGARAAYIYIG